MYEDAHLEGEYEARFDTLDEEEYDEEEYDDEDDDDFEYASKEFLKRAEMSRDMKHFENMLGTE